MDDEIHFGEVEHAALKQALRPDENRHYAVLPYGEANARDLAIYVDLDVLREMEEHAQSDTTVELGGVLLGAHYEDQQGAPFVVISDSLRAQHYESTKGLFKFTHDTWSAITRQREAFPADLQMVGWYHTHPGWGVFLSGMDMFICDNFFNKPLDVAYVIDPCRCDRGMFQWTGDSRERVRRTGGFFVTASRFRAAELEYYLAELSGDMPATISTRGASGSAVAPVVHLHQPQSLQPPWQAIAVTGALLLQFMLVALIALKTLAPPVAAPNTSDDKIAAALDKLEGSLTARQQVELSKERARAQGELLDSVVRELKGTDDGFVTRLQERFDQTDKLAADVSARDAQVRELRTLVEDHRSRLQNLEATAKREEERLKLQVARLTTENERLQSDWKKSKDELTALRAERNLAAAPEESEAQAGASSGAVWWWVGGAVLVAAAVVAGVWWIGGQRVELPSAAPDERQIEPT
jgi:proteasome lid subunit RPN8/RPN11